MAKRVRLTQRMRRRRAVEDNIPYPGTVNQPDRQFKKHDQYDNWEEVINHPLPDMRHDWKDDERDEIGFGIPEPWGESPTVASVKVAANKAVRLAILLLGEKTPEDVIEAQARDFMHLGNEVMDRTMARFAKTQDLYASDELSEEDDLDESEGETASDKTAATEGEEEAEEKAAETIQEEKEEEAKEASTKTAGDDEDDDDDDDDGDDDDGDDEEGKEASEAQPEPTEAATRRNPTDLDIELTSSMDDEVGPDPEVDAQLQAALFGDEPEPDLTPKREASEKKGVKKLGGQPRVASDANSAPDISGIWGNLDAPDVSDVFK
jgi:hypothetical protein